MTMHPRVGLYQTKTKAIRLVSPRAFIDLCTCVRLCSCVCTHVIFFSFSVFWRGGGLLYSHSLLKKFKFWKRLILSDSSYESMDICYCARKSSKNSSSRHWPAVK
uniref:Uncharacterized protein n=1 Tax=Opuntia streptacantha TaxID=393608 RepID=A0A7C8YWL1_OPUST